MRSIPDDFHAGSATSDPEPLLDIEQAARFLNVSETSLRRWTNDGRLACLRVGRRRERRFRKADLLAFMETQPKKSSRTAGPPSPGTHVCGLYSSDEGQVQQALGFLAGGFPPGTVTVLVGNAEARARILAGLKRVHPDLDRVVAEGQLVLCDSAPTAGDQLAWWEACIGEAVRGGATLVRAIGQAGEFAQGATGEELRQVESEYDRRIAQRYPVVTMCQYDARRISGPLVLDALRAHPHCFGQPAERILA